MSGNRNGRGAAGNRGGFTLAQTLTALAVLAVLLTLAMPATARYARGLRLTALDDSAHAVFLAAQNRLSGLMDAGIASSLALPERSFREEGVALWWLDDRDEAMNRLLPPGALEPALREGRWVVEFSVRTGTVRAVWYGEEDFSYRPGQARDRASRLKAEPLVGYWGLEGPDPLDRRNDALPVPQLTVHNGEELRLEIRVPRMEGMPPDGSLRLDVTLSGSGGGKTVLAGAGIWSGRTATLVLDTLKKGPYFLAPPAGPDWTLRAPFQVWAADSGLRPGEPVQVTVRLWTTEGSAVPRQAVAVCNSLFAEESAGHTARIACGRHLQNLDPGTSGVHGTITRAEQVAEVDYTAANPDPDSWYRTYGDRTHKPIENGALVLYEGRSLPIRGLQVRTEYAAGLFGELKGDIRLENILLVDARVEGRYCGGLVGMAEGIRISNCVSRLEDPKPEDGSAPFLKGTVVGGLLGSGERVDLQDSFAASILSGQQTGGLAGRLSASSVGRCAAAGHLRGTTVGGLVAEGSGTSLRDCYAAGTIEASSQRAAGLSPAPLQAKRCYAAVAWGEEARGTVLGALPRSGIPYVRQRGVPFLADSGRPVADGKWIKEPAFAGEAWFHPQGEENPAYGAFPYGLSPSPVSPPYPWPMLRGEGTLPRFHWGDWLEAPEPEARLVYYEVYEDGTVGLSLEPGPDPEQTGIFTLRSADGETGETLVTEDGYALLIPGEGEVPELQLETEAGQQPVPLADEERVVELEEDTFRLLPLAQPQRTERPLPENAVREIPVPETFYKHVTVSGRDFWFNPHFPQEVFYEKPEDENLPRAKGDCPPGTVLLRSPRHLAALAAYTRDEALGDTAQRWDVRQDLTLDYAVYRGLGGTFEAGSWWSPHIGAVLRGRCFGNGHEIRNLHLEDTGLFQRVEGPESLLQDLHLVDVTVAAREAQQHAGSLVGLLRQGTLENCDARSGFWLLAYVAGAGTAEAGGLIGRAEEARIRHCRAAVTVSGGTAGGLAGALRDCLVENAQVGGHTEGGLYPPGDSSVFGWEQAGGFAGALEGQTRLKGICSTAASVGVTASATAGLFAGSGEPVPEPQALLFALGPAWEENGPASLREESAWCKTGLRVPLADPPSPARPLDFYLPEACPWPDFGPLWLGDWPVPEEPVGFFYWEIEEGKVHTRALPGLSPDGTRWISLGEPVSDLCVEYDKTAITDWGYGFYQGIGGADWGELRLETPGNPVEEELGRMIGEQLSQTLTGGARRLRTVAYREGEIPGTRDERGLVTWHLERNGNRFGPSVGLHPDFGASMVLDGLPEGPWPVRTLGQLKRVGASETGGKGERYRQTHDLNGTDAGPFSPLGEAAPFAGHYDGGGHRILGLSLLAENRAALFARTEDALLERILLQGATIHSRGNMAGGLVGEGSGTIRHSAVADSNIAWDSGVFARSYGGGLAGRFAGTVEHCQAVTELQLPRTFLGLLHAGGLLGAAEGETVLRDCYAGGLVSGESPGLTAWTAGGLLAAGNARLERCYSWLDLRALPARSRGGRRLPLAPEGVNTDLCRYLESGAPGQGAGGLSLEELGRWSLATEGAGLAAVTWWEGEERYPMGAAVRAPAWPEGPPQWIHLGDWPRREYGDGETDG